MKVCTKHHDVDEGIMQHILTMHINDAEVGCASVMTYADGDAYVERIDVPLEYRNKGYGTKLLGYIASQWDRVYIAPDSSTPKRLYERVGEEVFDDFSASIDQGFGVYVLE